jgi:hypothetical protein
MDRFWDGDAGLLRHPDEPARHAVRESTWYALGLLQRDEPGDVDRARAALRAVLANQYHAEDAPFHGTFARAPEDPHPPDDAQIWIDYDPNWRQFIGCTLALLIDDFGDALGEDLCADLARALLLAVTSEPSDRVVPSYTNIALMRAWLDAWSGVEARGETMALAISFDVDAAGGFAEFNSPTYYGVDLFALALWCARPPTALFSKLGRDLDARLKRDIAEFHHPGLGNLCGPWLRSYGMDMRRYIALVGLYVDAVPDLGGTFEHMHDLCFAPLVSYLRSDAPSALDVPRTIDRVVAGRRVTARIGERSMWGAFADAQAASPQLHPATAHWRTDDGDIGWLRIRSRGRLDGEAVSSGLHVEVGERGATAEVFRGDGVVRFSRDPVVDGTKLRFAPGPLDVEIAR